MDIKGEKFVVVGGLGLISGVENCALANVCALRSSSVDFFCYFGTDKRISLKNLPIILLALAGSIKKNQHAPRSQATLVCNQIGSPKKNGSEISFIAEMGLSGALQRLTDLGFFYRAEVAACRRALGLSI